MPYVNRYTTKTSTNLNRLTRQRLAQKTLDEPVAREAIPAKVVGASPVDKLSRTGGAGIASPLTERGAERVLSDVYQLQSADGLLTLEYQNVLEMFFNDADDANVQIIYDDPDAP